MTEDLDDAASPAEVSGGAQTMTDYEIGAGVRRTMLLAAKRQARELLDAGASPAEVSGGAQTMTDYEIGAGVRRTMLLAAKRQARAVLEATGRPAPAILDMAESMAAIDGRLSPDLLALGLLYAEKGDHAGAVRWIMGFN